MNCVKSKHQPKRVKFCQAPGCGDWFMPSGGTQRYCSDACSKKVSAIRSQKFKKCKTCDNPFVGTTDFCGSKCAFVDWWKRDPYAQSKMPLVERLYKEGRGLKAISKETEVPRSTLRNWIVKAGIMEERDPSEARKNSPTRNGDLASESSLRHLELIRQHEQLKKKKRGKQNQSHKGLLLFEYAKKESKRSYYEKNKHKYAERAKQSANQKGFLSAYHLRYSTDPAFKAKEIYKRRFKKIVDKINGIGQGSRTMMALLGCTPKEFQRWIESQWDDWMTWDNIGKAVKGNWQIDHIIPCSWFDHSNQEHLQVCWNYLNLRPICAVQNNARRNKPNDLIETIEALPSHPMKDRMLQFASTRLNLHNFKVLP